MLRFTICMSRSILAALFLIKFVPLQAKTVVQLPNSDLVTPAEAVTAEEAATILSETKIEEMETSETSSPSQPEMGQIQVQPKITSAQMSQAIKIRALIAKAKLRAAVRNHVQHAIVPTLNPRLESLLVPLEPTHTGRRLTRRRSSSRARPSSYSRRLRRVRHISPLVDIYRSRGAGQIKTLLPAAIKAKAASAELSKTSLAHAMMGRFWR